MLFRSYCAAPREALLGTEPDNWYKGLSSYSDNIYKISVNSDTVELVYSPIDQVDVDSIVLSEDNSFLFYKNRNNDSLWAVPLIDI